MVVFVKFSCLRVVTQHFANTQYYVINLKKQKQTRFRFSEAKEMQNFK